MKQQLKIDFVSDVVCPWCAVGLRSLQIALERLDGVLDAHITFQPFELNQAMGPAGQDITEHLQQKYGSTPEQLGASRENIRVRGEELGFVFDMGQRARIYNTFQAHRLLHWAELQGKQGALKMALLQAYFTHGENPDDREVLVRRAASVGLDADRAREVLDSGAYAQEVRDQEQFYLQQGIHSVPAVIINDRHLISGGQPPELFEQALRQIAGV